ncbi:MAG TPA: hypothetical protein VGV37_00710 [Aliidongia sp.]|uniref:hypothetical protein n=1 Tax=Aliidongia sp. TaxID=1914230 RepID=UPI002DDCB353|nr:hypothetical protein [Aliidongia sp.]HEV2673027.1 hypothetical protein [Aliidongia sp.]
MTVAYVVRCNFDDPAREQAWNEWYNGPKLKQMLEKPYFLTGQRFKRVAGSGRDYLAFWTLVSEKAFQTPEYTNDWGFFEWRPYIIDWSRDLFAGESDTVVAAPRVDQNQFIRLVSFEGSTAEEAGIARAGVDQIRPGTKWYHSVGLDRHTELFGISIETRIEPTAAVLGAHEGFYSPISILGVSETPAEKA